MQHFCAFYGFSLDRIAIASFVSLLESVVLFYLGAALSEVRVVGSLALLYVFRMLGLFMILPILVLYGSEYEGATPFTLGIALGAYGLTQAIFQIPMGLLSDYLGRKAIIIFGLVVFAIGSLVAALSTSIEGVIIGRALQGSGAIASAIMAMVADLTTEENRTKAMAAIGASIGLSFTIAIILGPPIAAFSGLQGVFGLSAFLALVGIAILIFGVPSPSGRRSHKEVGAIPKLFSETLKNRQLLQLNWGIFTLHAVLMASFVAIPTLLEGQVSLDRAKHVWVYLPVLLVSFVAMLPLMLISEKKRKVKTVFITSIGMMGTSIAIFIFAGQTLAVVIVALMLFFIAFNFLEATLPSWVSKVAPAGAKGTAMGIYSSSQFLGAFAGGTFGGLVLSLYTTEAVLLCSAVLLLVWLGVALCMLPPKYLDNICYEVAKEFKYIDQVLALKGVEEAKHSSGEEMLYLKVDKRYFNELDVKKLIEA